MFDKLKSRLNPRPWLHRARRSRTMPVPDARAKSADAPAIASHRALDIAEIRKTIQDLLPPEDFIASKLVNPAWYASAQSIGMHRTQLANTMPSVRRGPGDLPFDVVALQSALVDETALRHNLRTGRAQITKQMLIGGVVELTPTRADNLLCATVSVSKAATHARGALLRYVRDHNIDPVRCETIANSTHDAAYLETGIEILAHLAEVHGIPAADATTFATLLRDAVVFSGLRARGIPTVQYLMDVRVTDDHWIYDDLVRVMHFSADGNRCIALQPQGGWLCTDLRAENMIVREIAAPLVGADEALETGISEDGCTAYLFSSAGLWSADLREPAPVANLVVDFDMQLIEAHADVAHHTFTVARQDGDDVTWSIYDLRGPTPKPIKEDVAIKGEFLTPINEEYALEHFESNDEQVPTHAALDLNNTTRIILRADSGEPVFAKDGHTVTFLHESSHERILLDLKARDSVSMPIVSDTGTAAFTPYGTDLCVATASGVYIYDLSASDPKLFMELPPMRGGVFSPDNDHLAVALTGGTPQEASFAMVSLRNKSFAFLEDASLVNDALPPFCFSPDGAKLSIVAGDALVTYDFSPRRPLALPADS